MIFVEVGRGREQDKVGEISTSKNAEIAKPDGRGMKGRGIGEGRAHGRSGDNFGWGRDLHPGNEDGLA